MNPKLDIRHLRVVCAIAECGSVTKASRQLHLTQSALSHQLRDAEEKLGEKLFDRLRKQMVLTAAGETLMTAARRALQEIGHAEEEIAALSGGMRGVIRISTECNTCYHWLPAVLTELQRDFPRVQVRLFPEETRFPIQALLDGRLDVAIISSETTSPELVIEPLFEDEMIVLLPKGHRLSRAASIRGKDLDGERIIVYPPQRDSHLLHKVMLPAGAAPSSIVEMPLTEGIIELVRGGFGIALMARWAAAPHLRSRELRAKSLAGGGMRRQWSAATRRDQRQPPYVAALIKLLKSARMPMRFMDTSREPPLRARDRAS